VTQTFTKERASESRTLVQLSRELDRPGKLGFITFVLPLILDSIFNKMAPFLFEANTLTLFQREGWTFGGIRRRKRLDRIGQVCVIAGVLVGLGLSLNFLVHYLANVTGSKSTTVIGGIIGLSMIGFVFSKLKSYLVPGLAPADVMAKTKTKLT